MKTKILLAAVAGALVLPAPMASQADVMSGMDFKISGRVSAAITRTDSDKTGESATWGLGNTTTNDSRTDSRITLSADRETDIGTAGFKLERDWTTTGLTDNRHQYVYFGGDWGTLYVGNHGNPVGMGNGYDQANFYGGGGRINDTDRHDGIGYTYSNGQFSLGVTLHGEGGTTNAPPLTRIADTRTDTSRGTATPETDTDYINRLTAEGTLGSGGVGRSAGVEMDADYISRLEGLNAEASKKADETVDTTIIGASYDLGIGVKIGAAYYKDNTETGHDSTSVMVNGTFNQFSYWVMFETASDARPNVAGNMKDDIDGYGVHLGYALSDTDKVYLQYGNKDYDLADKSDQTDIVVGYSHSFGGGATGFIEYRSRDNDDVSGTTNPDPSILAISARVSF